MEPSMHNMKIPPDSHIPENRPVPRRHHPLYSTLISLYVGHNTQDCVRGREYEKACIINLSTK